MRYPNWAFEVPARFLLVSFITYSQEKRLALVIGNSAYKHGDELKNPVNDAFQMKKALSEGGFEVQLHYNLSQTEMRKAIDEFGVRLKNFDVGLFFYAGHGIQANGYNYLIPVEANLKSEQDIEYDCVKADRVLAKMDVSGADVNIVILDACRNNPFERSWNRSSAGRGLAFMNAPSGTLIAYATAPGSTASDGTGRNGLYTSAILESIEIPSITIIQLFQNVRSLVTEKSNDQQTPWESTSLVGDFYLNPKKNDIGAEQITAKTNIIMDIDKPSIETTDNSYVDRTFSRVGIAIQSLVIPGLGLSRTTGNPHWLKGVVGYSCIGGSILFNKMAISTYDDFL